MEYRCEDRRRILRVKGRHWCHSIDLDSIFPKTKIIPPKKTNRSDRRCIWRYDFQVRVWNCQILNHVVESQLFTSWWKRYQKWLSDVELIQISVFSTSYSWINPCLTAGKRTGVWNCHATCGHRKKNIHLHIYSRWVRKKYGWYIMSFEEKWQKVS
jgi:hypothetical protein